MILDDAATRSMAQHAANMSNIEQTVYRRKDGSYIFCAKGNLEGLRYALKPNEQVQYVETIRPNYDTL